MENGNAFQMFQNSGYNMPRNRKKTLILDINDGATGDSSNTSLWTGDEFNIELFEPLIIDKQSELYLDNFVTFNSMLADKPERAAFCLRINEFNVHTNCASNGSNQNIKDTIIIPNENRNSANFFNSVSHKAKKYNYICDVNPMTISSLSGSIKDLGGKPLFHGELTTNKFTYALTGIKNWTSTDATARPLTSGQRITSIKPASGTLIDTSLEILTNTEENASTIFFSTPTEITITEYTNKEITIIVDSLYTFKVGSTGGSSTVQLLKGNGRMMAELSIISRDK